ncbi:hypothetical protein IPZ58_36110 [Streptomyces roseoverticillatus]|uniref:hypothetical protein n=1 Tax=Streptomyces roseoverticillatus TaxID=66429 RepID=UPI001F44EE65|nr:hypothetical protein [Streptomyces roseoverticillatus]MCF3106948.1 hypothetical protein [Streptomyces roseoverticillatus]
MLDGHELVAEARDHTLVVYALAQLCVGPPESRPTRVHDAYRALAGATDAIEKATEALLHGDVDAEQLGRASRDMSAAVILLAPPLGLNMTAEAGHEAEVPSRGPIGACHRSRGPTLCGQASIM